MNGVTLLSAFGVAVALIAGSTRKDESNFDAAKRRLEALPRIEKASWDRMKVMPGFEYGNSTAKVQVIGLLDIDAPAAAANMLAGSPNRAADMGCRTLMLTNGTHLAWNYAAKLRLAYSLESKYKVPGFKFDKDGKVTEPRPFSLKQEFDALPMDTKKKVEELNDAMIEAAKGVRRNTFYALLPNGEAVDIGHPFKVDSVWADYLTVQAGE